MHPTQYSVSRFWARYKKTYSSDKRIISFLNKICQCCTTVNYSPSSVVRYRKYSWINWEKLSIDSNTLKIQVVMRPDQQVKYIKNCKLFDRKKKKHNKHFKNMIIYLIQKLTSPNYQIILYIYI